MTNDELRAQTSAGHAEVLRDIPDTTPNMRPQDQAAIEAAIAALTGPLAQGWAVPAECQMDWSGIDMHHKKWTCRNCGRTHTRNSADGHPYFRCNPPTAAITTRQGEGK